MLDVFYYMKSANIVSENYFRTPIFLRYLSFIKQMSVLLRGSYNIPITITTTGKFCHFA